MLNRFRFRLLAFFCTTAAIALFGWHVADPKVGVGWGILFIGLAIASGIASMFR